MAFELYRTVQSASGFANRSVPANTFTNLDMPRTLVCPGPTTCRIEGDLWAQLFKGSTADNRWSLIMLVDGNAATVPTLGPFVGRVPSDGSPVAGVVYSSMSQLKAGTHTVQMQAFSVGGATVAYYNAVYHLYVAAKQ